MPTPKKPSPKPEPKVLWMVMKAFTWASLEVYGMPVQNPPEGPQRFVPVFDTREQAVAWAGTDQNVVMIESV